MITVRRMEERDAAAAAGLERKSFTSPWSEKDFQQMLLHDYARYYVAEDNGRVVGCCGLLDMAGEGEITNVAVEEAYRRKGIASMLLDRTLREGEAAGIKAFTLEVRTGNKAAICLYEKFGFQGVGERRNFYEKPRENALIMWKR